MNSNKRGLTLVEIILVIVIIGVLAAIAIPRITYLRKEAQITRLTRDFQNLQSLHSTIASELNLYVAKLTDPKDKELGIVMTDAFPPAITSKEIKYVDVHSYSEGLNNFRQVVKSNPEPETVSSAIVMMAIIDFRTRLSSIENEIKEIRDNIFSSWDVVGIFFWCFLVIVAISGAAIGGYKFLKSKRA